MHTYIQAVVLRDRFAHIQSYKNTQAGRGQAGRHTYRHAGRHQAYWQAYMHTHTDIYIHMQTHVIIHTV